MHPRCRPLNKPTPHFHFLLSETPLASNFFYPSNYFFSSWNLRRFLISPLYFHPSHTHRILFHPLTPLLIFSPSSLPLHKTKNKKTTKNLLSPFFTFHSLHLSSSHLGFFFGGGLKNRFHAEFYQISMPFHRIL